MIVYKAEFYIYLSNRFVNLWDVKFSLEKAFEFFAQDTPN